MKLIDMIYDDIELKEDDTYTFSWLDESMKQNTITLTYDELMRFELKDGSYNRPQLETGVIVEKFKPKEIYK